MQRILLRSLALAAARRRLLARAAATAAATDGRSADDTDVDSSSSETFSGDKKVESGKLDLALDARRPGGGSQASAARSTLKLAGPFQSQGEGKLPKFDFDVDASRARARTSRPA